MKTNEKQEQKISKIKQRKKLEKTPEQRVKQAGFKVAIKKLEK
jgi:hypothetical protein